MDAVIEVVRANAEGLPSDDEAEANLLNALRHGDIVALGRRGPPVERDEPLNLEIIPDAEWSRLRFRWNRGHFVAMSEHGAPSVQVWHDLRFQASSLLEWVPPAVDVNPDGPAPDQIASPTPPTAAKGEISTLAAPGTTTDTAAGLVSDAQQPDAYIGAAPTTPSSVVGAARLKAPAAALRKQAKAAMKGIVKRWRDEGAEPKRRLSRDEAVAEMRRRIEGLPVEIAREGWGAEAPPEWKKKGPRGPRTSSGAAPFAKSDEPRD